MASQSDQDWQSTKKTVLERNCYMFNNPFMSDVAFTCGESVKKFYAHKYVLATSSAVFHAMFYGDLAEQNSVIHLPDTDEESFEEFLRFLYTDQCTLTPDNSLNVMYLAKKYILPSLTEKCVAAIQRNTKPENVVTFLEQAIQFDEKEMERKCWQMIDLETSKAVASDAFNQISQGTLINLLKRETLIIKEIELFQAVLKWSDWHCKKNGLEATAENKRSVLGDAIYEIRFLSMSQKEFLQNVSLSGVLTDHEIVPIIHKFNGLHARGSKWELQQRRPKTLLKIRCDKFSSGFVSVGLSYRDASHCLSFSINQPITFHGVRLFGDDNRSKYEVTLEVNGAKVSGTYTSECKKDFYGKEDSYGFDVMLLKPILVKPEKNITMVATIKGPGSCCEYKEGASVHVKRATGFSKKGTVTTVTFQTITGLARTNETDATWGQFHELIFSV